MNNRLSFVKTIVVPKSSLSITFDTLARYRSIPYYIINLKYLEIVDLPNLSDSIELGKAGVIRLAWTPIVLTKINRNKGQILKINQWFVIHNGFFDVSNECLEKAKF